MGASMYNRFNAAGTMTSMTGVLTCRLIEHTHTHTCMHACMHACVAVCLQLSLSRDVSISAVSAVFIILPLQQTCT